MTKENIFFAIGYALIMIGSILIHIGLTVMILGGIFLFASYAEHSHKIDNDEDDED